VLLVKVGGGDVDLDAIAEDLASLDGPMVVVHGANRLRDELAGKLGQPSRVVESISGYSSVLSDDAAIDVLMAAYAGIRNKRLVEALRRRGLDAIGLTGLDGGVVRGTQNRGIRVGQRYEVHRVVDEITNAAGEVLDRITERVGVIEVSRVLSQSSVCTIVEGDAAEGDELRPIG